VSKVLLEFRAPKVLLGHKVFRVLVEHKVLLEFRALLEFRVLKVNRDSKENRVL
jgi:hypothetical protein